MPRTPRDVWISDAAISCRMVSGAAPERDQITRPDVETEDGEGPVTREHQSAYARTHELQGDVLPYVLSVEIEAIQEHARAAKDGRAGKTLVKEGPLTVTLVALQMGVQLEEHQVSGPALIQGLHGVARITTASGEVEVGPGTLVALDQGVAHAVQAVQDCTLLITLTGIHPD